MKIAFFETFILEVGGGMEKFFIETAISLREKKDVEIEIITLDNSVNKKLFSLSFFYYFNKKIKQNAENIMNRESPEILKEKLRGIKYFKCKNFKELGSRLSGYDVIYSKNEILEAFIFKFFLGYKKMPPVIFGVHTPHFFSVAESFHSKLHNFLYGSKFYNFLTKGVKVFHVGNLDSFQRLKKQFCGQKRVELIDFPFDTNNFIKTADAHKKEWNFNKDRINIAWVGRLIEQKGVNDLIWIINFINSDVSLNSRIAWNICGSGEDEDKITLLKDKWNNINYLGHVENNFIADFLYRNDLLISTSKWEVRPYNIIEAQVLGLPVISYDIPGCNDIVLDKVTGCLVKDKAEFVDKIKMFLGGVSNFDSEKTSKNIIEKFDSEKVYDQMFRMFKSVSRGK